MAYTERHQTHFPFAQRRLQQTFRVGFGQRKSVGPFYDLRRNARSIGETEEKKKKRGGGRRGRRIGVEGHGRTDGKADGRRANSPNFLTSGWNHAMDNHEQELHEHRLGQMGEGRKRMKQAKDKADTPHHAEPKGVIQRVVWDEDGLIIEQPAVHQSDSARKRTAKLKTGLGANGQTKLYIQYIILVLLPSLQLLQHIYGVVLKFDSKQIPQVIMDTERCVDCPYLQLEYASDQEPDYVHKRFKAEIDHNLDTGEFRITIRNGYGLDPERKRRMDKNYGKLNIIVAVNKRELNEGLYRVYTVDVLECVRNFVKNREIFFLHVDKQSISFEKFDIKEAISHKLQFQIRRRTDRETAAQCAMIGRRPPDGDNDCPWLIFKDKAVNQMRADKHIKQLGFRLAEFTHLVEVSFAPTLINEFFIHIDCTYDSSEPNDEPELVYHSSLHELDVANAHKIGVFPLLTAPVKENRVELVELPEEKILGHRTHRIGGHNQNRFSKRQKN